MCFWSAAKSQNHNSTTTSSSYYYYYYYYSPARSSIIVLITELIICTKSSCDFPPPSLLSVCRKIERRVCVQKGCLVSDDIFHIWLSIHPRPAKRHEGSAWFSSCNVLTYPPNPHRLVSSISGLSFSKPQRGNWVIQQRNKKKEGPVSCNQYPTCQRQSVGVGWYGFLMLTAWTRLLLKFGGVWLIFFFFFF